MKKSIFQSSELVETKQLSNLKGGGNLANTINNLFNCLDGGETDKRNKRPGTSSGSTIMAILDSI